MEDVTRTVTRVSYVKARDVQADITRAWTRLEQLVPLKGRKFYGAFFPATLEYWACVENQDGDEGLAAELERGILPGGRFAHERLKGDAPGVYALIAPTFDRISRQRRGDPSRPSIEFYRSRDEIDLYFPIAG